MIVKLDAKTGAEIWTMLLPTTQTNIGKKSGYETIAFTEDGGFIVGGYCKYTSEEFPFFKSSGQVSKIVNSVVYKIVITTLRIKVDDGQPLLQKFSANIAGAAQLPTTMTPDWTFICNGKGKTCNIQTGSTKAKGINRSVLK